jgi:hypothetical protein
MWYHRTNPRLLPRWARLHHDRGLLEVGPTPREWVARHVDNDALADQYLQLLEGVARG